MKCKAAVLMRCSKVGVVFTYVIINIISKSLSKPILAVSFRTAISLPYFAHFF